MFGLAISLRHLYLWNSSKTSCVLMLFINVFVSKRNNNLYICAISGPNNFRKPSDFEKKTSKVLRNFKRLSGNLINWERTLGEKRYLRVAVRNSEFWDFIGVSIVQLHFSGSKKSVLIKFPAIEKLWPTHSSLSVFINSSRK